MAIKKHLVILMDFRNPSEKIEESLTGLANRLNDGYMIDCCDSPFASNGGSTLLDPGRLVYILSKEV